MKHEEYLTDISNKIAEIFGLNFQPCQYSDLERRIFATAKELNIDLNLHKINNWLSQSSLTNIEFNALSANLTIGETYFYRERTALDLFKNNIIPELIKQRQSNNKKIRIWCAGCSSGEEPYTLAMIIKEYFPELSEWEITILATDISPVAVQKALQGEYTEWSFRDTDIEIKKRFFTSSGKLWRIKPEIKKMVTFSYLNLSKNSYPSSLTNTEEMDVIFCRNVMMYFTPQVIHNVSKRFFNSLNENAWLITSQVELNDEYFSNFERVNYQNGIYYKKTDKFTIPVTIKLTENIAVNNLKKTGKKTEIKKSSKTIKTEIFPITQTLEKKNRDKINPESFYQRGQYQQCIEFCLQLLENGDFDKEIFILLVKSYSNSGLAEEGAEMIKKIISGKFITTEMYYLYASFLNEQNEIQQSEEILKKGIYLNHTHILSHLMLADIFAKKNKKQLAIKHYGTVADLLETYNDEDIVPESDGITAGRIKALALDFINNQ